MTTTSSTTPSPDPEPARPPGPSIDAREAKGILAGDYGTQINYYVGRAPISTPIQVGILSQPIPACDPMALEVHPAITVPGQQTDTLPPYVARSHDALLDESAAKAVAGSSQMITLVGRSSTGKTRALWELIQRLEAQQPGRWQVWHLYDPTPPESTAAALEQAGPDMIIWLNEAQRYLSPSDPRLGEQVAAALRRLLNDPARGPVLILATLWPEHWTTLTLRPDADRPDQHEQARELLSGTDIDVSDTFAASDLTSMRWASDPRLRHAAQHAKAGRIAQYLAGAAELEGRYRKAPPAARAIIDVAIDARRLDHPPAIPYALLAQAAPGYLSDDDWHDVRREKDWLRKALAYTDETCRGVLGPLTRIWPRPGDPTMVEPMYRLADYLEQVGRTARAGIYPPTSFWDSLVRTITNPHALSALADQASSRGRYSRAVVLYRMAADRGRTDALWQLAMLREQVGDREGAAALCIEAADRGDTSALRHWAKLRGQAGDQRAAIAFYREAADRGDTGALRQLAEFREQAGDQQAVAALYREAADRGDTGALRQLAEFREQAGDQRAAAALYREAADRGDTGALRQLAELREEAGDRQGAEAAAREAAARGDISALWQLAELREEAGDRQGAEAAAREAAARGDISALRRLAELREQAEDRQGAAALYREAADRGDTVALWRLGGIQEWAGDWEGAAALYREAADRGYTLPLARLAGERMQAGDQAGADAFLREAADRGDNRALWMLAKFHWEAGDHEGAAAAAREAADGGDTYALRRLAELHDQADDRQGAIAVLREAADHGDEQALEDLAAEREDAGDWQGAAALCLESVDRGDIGGLFDFARLREWAGDAAAADNMRRFGLTDDGHPATSLD